MDVRGGRNRTGEMRHDSDFVRVAHCHDLQHFGDAADVRERRAGVVDIAIFDQRLELRSLTPFFAGREWHGRQHPKLRNLGPELFFPHRIFYQERPERLDQAADFERFMEVEFLMDVDRPVAGRSDSVSNLFRGFRDCENARARIKILTLLPTAAAARRITGARSASTTASSGTGPAARTAATWRSATADDAVKSGIGLNTSIDPVGIVPGGHRRRRALLERGSGLYAHRQAAGRSEERRVGKGRRSRAPPAPE